MKIAILLRGFSILNRELYKNYTLHDLHYKDHVLKLIEELKKNKKNQVSVYFHTYVVNNNISTLINDLDPEDFMVSYTNQITTPIDYIQANIFSLFSVISLTMKHILAKNKKYDIILMLGYDHNYNDIINLDNISSPLTNTQFHVNLQTIFSHKEELLRKGFIFGMHESQFEKMKEVFNESKINIDGYQGQPIKNILFYLCDTFMPINNKKIMPIPNDTFKLLNVKTNRYINIDKPTPENKEGVNTHNKGTIFKIKSLSKDPKSSKYLIAYYKNIKNQNGSDGWHLYTLPNDPKLFGSGNDGPWATFKIIRIEDKYLIKTFHENRNKYNNLGKYLYIDNDHSIKADGDISMEESYWKLIPSKVNPIEQLEGGVYKIINVKTKQYINVINPSPKVNNTVVANKKPALFVVYSNNGALSIKLELDIMNQNDTKGWHLYTVPKNNILYGAGNNGPWATFTVEKSGNYYLLKTPHKELNKMGKPGRYLYVSEFSILSDGDSSMEECLWDFVK